MSMVIGVPKETHRHEHRVGLTPFAVARLTREGHTVLVEREAGAGGHFGDRDFQNAGARTVYSAEEVYQRSDMVARVGMLSTEELEFLKPGLIVTGFHHLAVSSRPMVERLLQKEITLVGYEIIEDGSGDLPVLLPFSEMAGQMAVHLAAHYAQNSTGGRGILLGSVPGVPPPTVLILGAGTVGRAAARQALASGAHVIVLDADLAKLRRLNRDFLGRAVTVMAGLERLEKYTALSDVVIGAILIPGGRPDLLITEAMVKSMKQGSVIIDVSIDQGGCVETSRPTDIENPTFKVHGALHYCVPNMTANIPRTASRALATAALPYLLRLAEKGLAGAAGEDPGLAAGVYLCRGKMVKKVVGETLGFPVTPLASLLEKGARS